MSNGQMDDEFNPLVWTHQDKILGFPVVTVDGPQKTAGSSIQLGDFSTYVRFRRQGDDG